MLSMLSRKLEVLENERYNPLVGGWGKQGLLPTDRLGFSDRGGANGFSTIDEVNGALLSSGWKWEASGTWEVSGDPSTDSDGWSYGADFSSFGTLPATAAGGSSAPGGATVQGSISVGGSSCSVGGSSCAPGDDGWQEHDEPAKERSKGDERQFQGAALVGGLNGSPVKHMIHFVRRRRLSRYQVFDAEQLADCGAFTCDHCDMEEVERISAVLLQGLAAATLKAHPRSLTEAKCNKVKSLMLSALHLRGDPISAGQFSTKIIASRLEEFTNDAGSAWSSVSGFLAGGSPLEMVGRRTADLAHAYFTHEERRVVAGLVIRKHDMNFQYHCDKANCGQSCEFRRETCPNEHCGSVYSAKWCDEHDKVCPQKILPCPRQCGDHCTRRLMPNHLGQACSLRPAQCPYKDLGCMADLCHKDVPGHLDACMPSHLLLSMSRIQEQQNVIVAMHQRLMDLEIRATGHGQQIVAITAAASTLAATVEMHDKRQQKALHDEVHGVSKSLHAVSKEMHAGFAKSNGDISALNRSLLEIRPFLAALKKP